MKQCPKCGTECVDQAIQCPKCQTDIKDFVTQAPLYGQQSQAHVGGCPKCGSQNIQVVSDVSGKTKGFGAGKGCLGYLCLGPFGWLCGLCGMGKGKTTTSVYRMCANCGTKFK